MCVLSFLDGPRVVTLVQTILLVWQHNCLACGGGGGGGGGLTAVP